ncbi:hypothetical protein EB241_06260 [Erwinia psidii]|uniref:Uncharacterized protein n=1 Tax=Erwinia psidii TaxID=69224 RepID=A0A3N6S3B8_9GAMM|nr:hypothetical protein EB241_06260 [Erwinia psidii]
MSRILFDNDDEEQHTGHAQQIKDTDRHLTMKATAIDFPGQFNLCLDKCHQYKNGRVSDVRQTMEN